MIQYRLPNLPEPLQVVQEPSKRILFLVPIYGLTTKRHKRVGVPENYLMAALWNKRSWQLHSDLLAYHVDFKFYMEARLIEELGEVLEQNFVDVERDVISFENPLGLEEEAYGLFVKKLGFMYDDRFRRYTHIIELDADTMIYGPPGAPPLPFLEHFYQISSAVRDRRIGLYRFHEREFEGHRRMLSNQMLALPEEARMARIHEKCRELFGVEPPVRYFAMPGWFQIYPARYFHKHRQGVLTSIRELSPVMGSSEQLLGLVLFNHNPEDRPIYAFGPELKQDKSVRRHFRTANVRKHGQRKWERNQLSNRLPKTLEEWEALIDVDFS